MTTVVQQNEYSQMVTKLAKPGALILATLNPAKTHFMHMLLGLAGEGYEFNSAVTSGDFKTVKEELGDIHFYLEGAAQALGIELFLNPEMSTRPIPTGNLVGNLLEALGDVVDTGKKLVIYNQPERTEKFVVCTSRLWFFLEAYEQSVGLSMSDVLEANMNKLLTGANARYKDGYSDAAAKERADKAGQEDDHA